MPSDYKYNRRAQAWEMEKAEQEIDYDALDEESWGLLVSYWRAMPDRLLDLLESDNPNYSIGIVQRINIRAFCQYEHAFITGSRGFTKSFTSITSKLLLGILYPGITMRYYGPSMRQMAEIASEKWEAIKKQWPGLAAHWDVVSNAKESFEVKTKYGSLLSITVVRGNDCNGITGEEIAQSEAGKAFDFKEFSEAILPTARVRRMVNKVPDPFFPNFQKNYITSAGQQQGEAYQYRCDTNREMLEKDTAILIEYPWTVAVLAGIRDENYYSDLRKKMTPEAQLREIESVWTGTSENPIIRDAALTESAIYPIMENRHCGDPNCIYIIGYDVSYADGARNAKCATSVLKCEPQRDENKRDKYLKTFVYLTDNDPPRDQVLQARQLKDRWYRFCLEGGKGTYISLDSWQYGKAVLETLHKDLGDGLPPLCCVNHEFREIELPGAIPCIYAIKATGGYGAAEGSHDPDAEMIRYAELEWEHRNVRLLIPNVLDGVAAYKAKYRIKDDSLDAKIALPYIKTREMRGQIANLQKKPTAYGFAEKRISNRIQRDMWSASKYALRLAEILEREDLISSLQRQSEWKNTFMGIAPENASQSKYGANTARSNIRARIVERHGGNTFNEKG